MESDTQSVCRVSFERYFKKIYSDLHFERTNRWGAAARLVDSRIHNFHIFNWCRTCFDDLSICDATRIEHHIECMDVPQRGQIYWHCTTSCRPRIIEKLSLFILFEKTHFAIVFTISWLYHAAKTRFSDVQKGAEDNNKYDFNVRVVNAHRCVACQIVVRPCLAGSIAFAWTGRCSYVSAMHLFPI